MRALLTVLGWVFKALYWVVVAALFVTLILPFWLIAGARRGERTYWLQSGTHWRPYYIWTR